MAKPLAPEGEGPEDDLDEPIEVAGVPLAVWAVRLSIFLFIQGAIVLASYAYYGFGTDPSHFGPGFRLDPLHAAINLIWGLAGSIIGFFVPRFAIDFLLAFAFFFTAIAAVPIKHPRIAMPTKRPATFSYLLKRIFIPLPTC